MKLTTTIDVTLGRGQNMREHYRARANRVKEEREATAKALKAAPLAGEVRWGFMANRPTTGGARVTLMRPIARIPLDTDNLSGAFKGVRDEVASFLGVDDRSDRIHWVYTQEKGKGLKPTITIEVMPVGDIDPQVKRVRELEAALAQHLVLAEVGWRPDVRGDLLEHTRRLLAPTIGGVPVLTDSNLPDGVIVIHSKG
jgi:hypothetical protein